MHEKTLFYDDLMGTKYGITSQGFIRSKTPKRLKPAAQLPGWMREMPSFTDDFKDLQEFYQGARPYVPIYGDSWFSYGPNPFAYPFSYPPGPPAFECKNHDMRISSDVDENLRSDSRRARNRNPSYITSYRRKGDAAFSQCSPIMNPVNMSPALPHADQPDIFQPHSSRNSTISFAAAARQLKSTVIAAVAYFEKFNETFKESSSGIMFHADGRLLNDIWKSQIRKTTSHPEHNYAPNSRRRRNGPTQDQSQEPDPFRERGERSATEDHTVTGDEPCSFNEQQRRVLTRLDQLISSVQPQAPISRRRNRHPGDDSDDEYHEQDCNSIDKHQATVGLMRKVRNSAADLRHALQGMGSDFRLADAAIRELYGLLGTLRTYQIGWDPYHNAKADDEHEGPGQGDWENGRRGNGNGWSADTTQGSATREGGVPATGW